MSNRGKKGKRRGGEGREGEKVKGEGETEEKSLKKNSQVKVCWMESALCKYRRCNTMISCYHLSVNLQYCSRKALAQGLVLIPVPELHPSPVKSISLSWQPMHQEGEGEGQFFVFPTGCSCPSHAGFVALWNFAKQYCLMMPDGSITRGGCSSGWGCLIVLAAIHMQAPSS